MSAVWFALALSAVLARSPQDDLEQLFQMFHQGRASEAVQRAEAWVAEKPDDPVGHHLLGRFYFHQGKHEAAVAELERCLALGPTQGWQVAWTHTVLGQSLAALGREGEAKAHLRRAVELDATRNSTRQALQTLQALGEVVEGLESATRSPWLGRPFPEMEFQGLAGEVFRPHEPRGTPYLYKLGPSW